MVEQRMSGVEKQCFVEWIPNMFCLSERRRPAHTYIAGQANTYVGAYSRLLREWKTASRSTIWSHLNHSFNLHLLFMLPIP